MRARASAPRRRPHRPLSAALAGAAADRGNRGRVRGVARRRARSARSACRTFPSPQLDEWRATGVPLHLRAASVQHPPAGGEADVLPWCAAHDVGVISYSPLFRGLLFGTWSREKTFPPDDGAQHAQGLLGPRDSGGISRRSRRSAPWRPSGGLSVPAAGVGVLLQHAGAHGCHRRRAECAPGRAGGQPGVGVTAEQAAAVWAIVRRLGRNLAKL